MAWDSARAKAVEALVAGVPATVEDGHLRISLSLTPVFIEPTE
jgi:hypothetical protein